MPTSRETIISAAARAMFVSLWADTCSCGSDYEDCRLGGESNPDFDPKAKHESNDPGNGVELMDIAPETSEDAMKAGRALIEAIEKANGNVKIHKLFDRAAKTKGRHYRTPTVKDFGHYLAMSALGHGVSWTDDHPEAGILVPDLMFCGPIAQPSWSVDVRFTNVRA